MLSKVNEEVNLIKSLLLKTHEEALFKNEEQTARWQQYKNDHENLHSRLLSFRDKLTHSVMVPIGTKALMKGSLVHTNEILVCLGDNWFAKKSANEAAELCQRRIKGSDEMLIELKKEQDLLEARKTFPSENEAFGKEEVQEIIEPYDEDAEKSWRVRHRQKEKEYYEKLAELKKHQKDRIETEEDLWKRLDALDLQEELEDELDRLNEGSEDESLSSETETESSEEEECLKSDRKTNDRRVSFDNTSDSCNDAEPIQITFKHSSHLPPPCQDMTPNSIYTMFSECFNRAPKSILKRTSSYQEEDADTNMLLKRTLPFQEDNNIINHEVQRHDQSMTTNMTKALGDVVERTEQNCQPLNNTRPVSKFKAARQAAKAQNR